MPYTTLATRTKTGTTDDASPVSSAPDAAAILDVPTIHRMALEQARGWTYYLAFYDVAGAEILDATADVTPWIRDEQDGSWFACDTDEAVGHREGMQVDPVFGGAALFFQLTNIEGTGIVAITVRVGSF